MDRPLFVWIAVVSSLVVALGVFLSGRFATALYMTILVAGVYVFTEGL